MSDLDKLINSSISLISHRDVRYDGILFSINAEESSIVLREVICYGTEDRVQGSNAVPSNPESVIPFVTFPGQEIKDLSVHSKPTEEEVIPEPPKTTEAEKPKENKPSQTNTAPPKAPTEEPKRNQRPAGGPRHSAGTGAHLMKMREKKGMDGTKPVATGETFDFQAGLDIFKKDEVLAKVQPETNVASKYQKDDFFDTMSCDLTDRQNGVRTRMTYSEERTINQDTFGAIALQNNNYRRGGRGYRGRGRGGGRYNGSNSSGRWRDNNYQNRNNSEKRQYEQKAV